MTLQQQPLAQPSRATTPSTSTGQSRSASAEVRPPATLRATPFPAAFGKAMLLAAHATSIAWQRAQANVEAVQERTLRDLLRHSAGTEFGKKHGFRDIKNHADFARRVPIGDYDAFSPYIERMRKGEHGLLVPEPIVYYGNSSGSSVQGKSKFLPISERQVVLQRRAAVDALMRYLAWRGDDTFPMGFTLGLFPPTTMKREGATFVTSNPALMATRIPLFSRPAYLPHDDIKVIANYDEKLAAITERYLDHDVRTVAGTTCWFPLLFEKVIQAANARGRRATCVKDVWPNLRFMIGGGVSADPYMPLLKRLVGRDDLTLIDTYNATEGGIYAATDHAPGLAGMAMIPHRGTFFEFVPMDERESTNPSRVPLWAVERDRPYSIVVTSVSGLYAYELGDIVRFPETRPPRIEFMGRLAGCLSVTQELTTHVEIERAVAFAVGRTPCRTLDFGAAADVGVAGSPKSRYALFVEFEEGHEPASLEAFASAFDEGLQNQNRVYREHRSADVAILPPRVVPLASGAAKRFLDEITRGNVQGKFPRILDESRKAKLIPYARSATFQNSASVTPS